MSTRTVRLDEESERLLAKLCRAKDLSVSAALKQGLQALSDALDAEGPTPTPYAVYEQLDLGPGGYSRAGARSAKAEIARIVRGKIR
jgi:hypothetical protein